MKAILASLLLLLACQLKAQTTTAEEYDFVTSGYKAQLDSRQPMKRGYTLIDMGTYHLFWNNGTNVRGFDFKMLFRDNDKNPCAIMAIYFRNENGINQFREYFCLPTGADNPLWDKTVAQITNSWNSSTAREMYSAMIFATMKMLATEVSR